MKGTAELEHPRFAEFDLSSLRDGLSLSELDLET
jgi:hypothetical protein